MICFSPRACQACRKRQLPTKTEKQQVQPDCAASAVFETSPSRESRSHLTHMSWPGELQRAPTGKKNCFRSVDCREEGETAEWKLGLLSAKSAQRKDSSTAVSDQVFSIDQGIICTENPRASCSPPWFLCTHLQIFRL